MRIVVAVTAGLLREILQAALSSQPDMLVVAWPATLACVPSLVSRTGADVVVLGLAEDVSSAEIEQLLWECPRVPVVVLERDARGSSLHELRPTHTDLGEPSISLLHRRLRAIRAGRGPGRPTDTQ